MKSLINPHVYTTDSPGATAAASLEPLPTIIQGGMGIAVSQWRLAQAVSQAGQLGVISSTALAIVLARRLQDGDKEGHMRRAMSRFPVPEIARRLLVEFFVPQGRAAGGDYRGVPMPAIQPGAAFVELTVMANFVEVFLAKE
ncbi:MAG: hypothetical protein KGJ37_07685, partial [Verrucomicrobiota bacterium]|nr:hypothetical protein [Verrucomicrobiota bacterium]